LQILFKNDCFLAVDKPHGVLSVPPRQVDDRAILGPIVSQQENITKLWIVHRLDYEVSGVVLLALTAKAHEVANAWFESRQIKKIYQAITTGVSPNGREFLWKSVLMKGKKRAYEAEYGKEAVTEALFKGVFPGDEKHLLWELRPRTGRSHQLRYELSKRGFPILGDKLYGSTKVFHGGNHVFAGEPIALRSVALDFSRCQDAQEFGLPTEIRVSSEFASR